MFYILSVIEPKMFLTISFVQDTTLGAVVLSDEPKIGDHHSHVDQY